MKRELNKRTLAKAALIYGAMLLIPWALLMWVNQVLMNLLIIMVSMGDTTYTVPLVAWSWNGVGLILYNLLGDSISSTLAVIASFILLAAMALSLAQEVGSHQHGQADADTAANKEG